MTTRPLSVAFQGERGAFSHQAALSILGPDVQLFPKPTFDALFEAAVSGEVERAVVPIENSLAGSIHENYDRLRARPLHIVAETQMRIVHCLIGRPGARLEAIEKVSSHPVALAQCRRFFADRPHVQATAAYDTAGSVLELLRDGADTHAAIASALAAPIYGGEILLEGIEDDPQNYTRFLILAQEPGPIEKATKTSIVFILENAPGALHRALGAFSNRGVDLSKIESRPLRGRPWEYEFHLDVLGSPQAAAGEAIEHLRAMSREFRVLGSYPDGLKKTF
jgi:prephenate dehydratase